MREARYLPPGELAVEAASRIAVHVRRLRRSWPALLADQASLASRRTDAAAGWPDWCWLPMGGTITALNRSRRPFLPADIAFAAAVGQWRLTGRQVIVPSVAVAEASVPGVAGHPAEMDLRLPREGLVEDLAGACSYLVMPRRDHGSPLPGDGLGELYGTYLHLEYDSRPEQGAELRLLLDFERQLVQVPVLLTQPTLAWSAAKLAGHGFSAELDQAAGEMSRVMAWLVWPLVGAMIDPSTQMAKTMVLNGGDVPADARGAEVWEIGFTRPRPRLSLAGDDPAW